MSRGKSEDGVNGNCKEMMVIVVSRSGAGKDTCPVSAICASIVAARYACFEKLKNITANQERVIFAAAPNSNATDQFKSRTAK